MLANCKKYFATMDDWKKFEREWQGVVYSATIEVFDANWKALQETYQSMPRLVDYLANTWIEVHKTRFVAAWTNNYMHFGNVNSSRVEGAHSMLKSYLQVLTKSYFKKAYSMMT
jgi:hypothetical protein